MNNNWTITWHEGGESKQINFDNVKENHSKIKDVIEELKRRKELGEISNLVGLRPDGTAKVFNEEPNLVWGARVSFGTKTTYPYEAPGKLEEGDEVLVDPNGMLAIGTVTECKRMERNALVAECNGHRLRKIIARLDRMRRGIKYVQAS